MKSSHKTLLTIVISVIVCVGGLILIAKNPSSSEPGQYDQLAQCLTDKGAKFYGAYWCPHCAQQKKLFGASMKNITYVECGLPGNQQGSTQACQDAKVESYPTWIFADGSRLTGEQLPKDLAEKAGCSVDSATSTPTA